MPSSSITCSGLRRAAGVVGIAAASASAFAVGDAPASSAAQSSRIQCFGAQRATYKDRAQVEARETKVKVVESYPFCEGAVRSARGKVALRERVSCAVPTDPVAKPDTIRYRFRGARRSSLVTFTVTTVTRAVGETVVVSVGTVTRGYRRGDDARRVVRLPNADPDACASEGVKRQTGSSQLTIG